MPEGKPLFTIECADVLSNHGMTLEQAEADFRAGVDAEGTGDLRHRYGHLGVYQYRRLVIMRQADVLVTGVWIGERRA